MQQSITILNALLPFFYMFVFAVYLYDFFNEKKALNNSKRIVLFLTLLFHVHYLISRTIEFDHPPITSKLEIFSIIAASIAFSYFILELLTDIRGTGAFIIFFSLVFQTISSLFITHNYIVPEVLRNRMLGLHVINALLGYSGITISAVYGLLYMLLYKNLKTNKFGLVFNRLPNLEILERLSFSSAVIGFVLLTVAMTIGMVWLPSAFPNFSYFDPKLIGTIFVWLIYGIGISSRLLGTIYGKKAILFSLIGFIVAISSLIVTNTLAKTFHSFY
jgi:HemX protein